jgi:hypothetical protein
VGDTERESPEVRAEGPFKEMRPRRGGLDGESGIGLDWIC